ncbi:hypothetical protein D3C85_681020 [compost metagenome]
MESKYFVKAYSSKNAKSAEAGNIVIDSVFENLMWCGLKLNKREKEELQRQVEMYYDVEFTIRGCAFRICKQNIKELEN